MSKVRGSNSNKRGREDASGYAYAANNRLLRSQHTTYYTASSTQISSFLCCSQLSTPPTLGFPTVNAEARNRHSNTPKYPKGNLEGKVEGSQVPVASGILDAEECYFAHRQHCAGLLDDLMDGCPGMRLSSTPLSNAMVCTVSFMNGKGRQGSWDCPCRRFAGDWSAGRLGR